jgi:hypothetical protein
VHCIHPQESIFSPITRLKIPAQKNASSYSLASNRDMNFFKVYEIKSAKDDRLAPAVKIVRLAVKILTRFLNINCLPHISCLYITSINYIHKYATSNI